MEKKTRVPRNNHHIVWHDVVINNPLFLHPGQKPKLLPIFLLSVFLYQLFDKTLKRNKPMGKRGGGGASKKPPLNTLTASNKSFALSAKGGNHNPRSLLRLEHLQNLASWATEEASIPSLAAFFGRQFASSAEALGVPLDPSALFQCQRLVLNVWAWLCWQNGFLDFYVLCFCFLCVLIWVQRNCFYLNGWIRSLLMNSRWLKLKKLHCLVGCEILLAFQVIVQTFDYEIGLRLDFFSLVSHCGCRAVCFYGACFCHCNGYWLPRLLAALFNYFWLEFLLVWKWRSTWMHNLSTAVYSWTHNLTNVV